LSKLDRISAILVRLQSRSAVTARQIADEFGVSLRTVYRDIRVLEESGIPITGEAGHGYSLVDGYKLPPLMFSAEEAIAFLMAGKLVNRQADGDTYKLYSSGMNKIRAVLKSAEKNILEDFDKYVQVPEKHMPPKSEPAQILQPLLRCILQQRAARIEYDASYNNEITNREIEPLGFYFMVNNWYVMAWCRMRKDYRTFSLSRIRKLIPCDCGFGKERPALRTLLDKMYADDVVYSVKVKVEKTALRNMGMTRYVFGLTGEEEYGEYVIQHYLTHSLEKLARWYLFFADQAEILEPAEFKWIVKELVDKISI
jgi:predicted DNA-binding transcriptional regulator YafY